VDDDVSVREAVGNLIRSAGLKAMTFESAQEFLAGPRSAVSCLVLDVEMPGLSGLDLQEELAKGDPKLPIIFLTGRGDIPMTVRALKAGALEFLTKPFDDEELLSAIRQGIARWQSGTSGQESSNGIMDSSAALKAIEAAILEERNRMARDIHDTLAQGFTGVIMQLAAAEDSISCGHHQDANKHLSRAETLARQSLSEVRRSVHALRPDILEHTGLWEALKGMAKNMSVGTPLRTTCKLRGKLPELPPTWQENLLHIGQEALTNTLKYAHAQNFEMRLVCNGKRARLEFFDDGVGFALKDSHDGVGLTGMRERVTQMGGEMEITSSRGKGTKITVLLRCNANRHYDIENQNTALTEPCPSPLQLAVA
jgi:signal transduction histidine kinase